jgi:hypothetical protein
LIANNYGTININISQSWKKTAKCLVSVLPIFIVVTKKLKNHKYLEKLYFIFFYYRITYFSENIE